MLTVDAAHLPFLIGIGEDAYRWLLTGYRLNTSSIYWDCCSTCTAAEGVYLNETVAIIRLHILAEFAQQTSGPFLLVLGTFRLSHNCGNLAVLSMRLSIYLQCFLSPQLLF